MAPASQPLPSYADRAVDEELLLSVIEAQPRLIGLHRYWDSKRAGRAMPARGDLWPEEMVAFLGYILLVDVESAPRRFRYRLIGTEIVNSYGVDLTGRYTSELRPDEYRNMVERHYGEAVDQRRPRLHRMEFTEKPGKVHELIRFTLPLADDGATVNMLIAASVFGPELRRFREIERTARRQRDT